MARRRFLFPLMIGVLGCTVLAALGVWQLQRLQWKESVLAEIEARIAEKPVALPESLAEEVDKYLPVTVEGDLEDAHLRVLTSIPRVGPGFRLITPFVLPDGRRIMVDEGFVRENEDAAPDAAVGVTIVGNVHWPDDANQFTPEPDLSRGLFFGRDLPAMAAVLDTDPILVVARRFEGLEPRAMPLPVTTEGIPNNHLGYAVQWFGLALVWAGMTAFLLWRTAWRTE
ncbi:MAG: SURF1 family protein [Pseudomonadota bacterium]